MTAKVNRTRPQRPRKRSPRAGIYITPEAHAKLTAYAERHGHQLRWCVERAIDEWLAEQEGTKA